MQWFRAAWVAPLLAVAACGQVGVEQGATGGTLCFDYYQRCVDPVFNAVLVNEGNVFTCAASGCHQNPGSAGGAFKIFPGQVPLASIADPAQVHQAPIYANFLSAKGAAYLGAPRESFLIRKPLVEGVLHGGGRVFANDMAPGARQFLYWITNRASDELSPQCAQLFDPGLQCKAF